MHEHTPIHRAAPVVKVVAAVAAVVSVAITPRLAIWAFAIYAAAVAIATRVARVPPTFLLARLSAVLPFVVFALFIPFVASGETTEVLGMTVSVPGLWGMWNILVKAALGASLSILLTATTEVPDILKGLRRLRVPAVLTSIAMFMIRYLELVAQELESMRVAMTSRGYDPRWIAQARPIAASAGSLFIRSYERAERVHAAMVSRGFSGVMPLTDVRETSSLERWVLAGLVALFAGVAITANVVT